MNRAFTLIEVMAVVLLVGLISAGMVWSFSGSLAKSAMIETIEQIRYMDSSARRLARQGGRDIQVVFDLDEGRILRRGAQDAAKLEIAVSTPIKIRLARVGGRDEDSGRVVIDYTARGLSHSYAVELVGGEQTRWVVVAGLSGDVLVRQDDGFARAIFSANAARRDVD